MDTDGPCSQRRTLSLDIQRMASGINEFDAAAAAAACTTTMTYEAVTIREGSAHLSAEALAMIHGQVPPAQKKLMYSNSLRRRSIEVDVQ